MKVGKGLSRALLACLVLVAAGCASPRYDTPESCLQAFDAAMREGDMTKAAALFALDVAAAEATANWATRTPRQRRRILNKMRQEKARQLAAWRAAYLRGDYRPTAPHVAGDWANLILTGPNDAVTARFHRREDGWRLYQVGAPVPEADTGP